MTGTHHNDRLTRNGDIQSAAETVISRHGAECFEVLGGLVCGIIQDVRI